MPVSRIASGSSQQTLGSDRHATCASAARHLRSWPQAAVVCLVALLAVYPAALWARPIGDSKLAPRTLVVVQDRLYLSLLQHTVCRAKPLAMPLTQLQQEVLQCLSALHAWPRCSHVFSHTVKGIAGHFKDQHLQLLHKCLQQGLMYMETDGQVHKAEGPKLRVGLRTRQLQQAPAGPADGAFNSVSLERQLELAELVGTASRDQLSRGNAALAALLVAHTGGANTEQTTLQQSAVDDLQEQGKVNDPASDLPMAPADLPDAAPGPASRMLDRGALSALATVINKPVEKVERLPPALWGLDRIDQQDIPLDGTYTFGSTSTAGTGEGVTIYALDSGIRGTHQEFQGWVTGQGSRVSCGHDFVSEGSTCGDVDGHGTHVAATAVGRSVGVAKGATLVSVRVLDAAGSGSISDTVAGLDWIAQHHQRPAVVMMSLGVTEGTWSRVLEQSVSSLIHDHGITAIVAAGNSGIDACDVSPASLADVITVAASNLDNKFSKDRDSKGPERMYSWSNTGRCVDVFAPGVEIWSACGSKNRCPVVSDDAYTWASGTSMAVPHVAGVAALYLSQHPQATPAQVSAAITRSATRGKIKDGRMKDGTPNKLLYTGVT